MHNLCTNAQQIISATPLITYFMIYRISNSVLPQHKKLQITAVLFCHIIASALIFVYIGKLLRSSIIEMQCLYRETESL